VTRQISLPSINCEYVSEPELEFANGNRHVDPKTGLYLFGPKSFEPRRRHPEDVRVGLIGSADTLEVVRRWLERNAAGVEGNTEYLGFAGFMPDRGFRSRLVFDDDWVAQLTRREIDDVIAIVNERERFEQALVLLQEKMSLLAGRDRRPECVIVALPKEFFDRCKIANYRDRHLGLVHRDLRRAFKATVMRHQIPTQIILESTLTGPADPHPASLAWNFFTGLYTKAGGFAWGPTGLTPRTCYVGISFHRPLGTTQANVQTSVAQAFDEHGEGLILRGPDFNWNPDTEGTRAPHLSEDMAAQLLTSTLERYLSEMGQPPERVVVHKSSRYWPEERAGFESALRNRTRRYDLVALAPQETVRLFPESKYPPLRGTRFSIGNLDYLYTEGFVAEMGKFYSLHVPLPLQIADHIGFDSTRETLAREILALTKMNWNSTRLGGLLPITLKFSRLVGDIIKELPHDFDPLTNYKYYM
jgi:hypothetical protein